MTWQWALPLLLVVGMVLGFYAGRSSSTGIKRSVQLDQELRETWDELHRYQDQVVDHFKTTADLVNRMTENYRAVYDHLAKGAHQLAGNQAPQMKAIPRNPDRDQEPPAATIGEGLHEDFEGDGPEEEPTQQPRRQTSGNGQAEESKSSGKAKGDGWYNDVAPGTEVPGYAKEKR